MSKKIDDFGEKIGGARKDRFKKGLSYDDYRSLTPSEADFYVKKDNLWPVPDYAGLVDSGISREVVATMKVIRDKIASSPNLGDKEESVLDRRDAYVELVHYIKKVCEEAKDINDFNSIGLSNLVKVVGSEDYRTNRNSRTLLYSIIGRGREDLYNNVFSYSSKDRVSVRKLLETSFPHESEPWLKNVRFRKYGDRFLALSKGDVILARGSSEDELKEILKNNYEQKKSSNFSEEDQDFGKKKIPSRPHLENYDRIGLPDYRHGKDVDPDDFLLVFRFRGVEFGNWLPNDERQEVLNMAYDALMDLATVLDLEPSSLSLNGTLGLAFGARGKGKAAAHYDPTYKAINLTRLRGGGSLAHEFFHAFDDYVSTLISKVATGRLNGGTGWLKWTNSRKIELKNLSSEQSDAWDVLMKTIRYRKLSKQETKDLLIKEAKSKFDEVSSVIKKNEDYMQSKIQEWDKKKADGAFTSFDARDEMETKKRHKKAQDNNITISSGRMIRLESLRKMSVDQFEERIAETNYFTNAQNLSGKSTDGYWQQPTEMGARAFEAMVYDRMEASGMRSPYLVSGVDEEIFATPLYKGNPYPCGQERHDINDRMSVVVDVMKIALGVDELPSAKI